MLQFAQRARVITASLRIVATVGGDRPAADTPPLTPAVRVIGSPVTMTPVAESALCSPVATARGGSSRRERQNLDGDRRPEWRDVATRP